MTKTKKINKTTVKKAVKKATKKTMKTSIREDIKQTILTAEQKLAFVIERIEAKIKRDDAIIADLKASPITHVTTTKIGPSLVKVKKGMASYILKNGKMVASCGLKGKFEDKKIVKTGWMYTSPINEDKEHDKLLEAGTHNLSPEDIDRPNAQASDYGYEGSEYSRIKEDLGGLTEQEERSRSMSSVSRAEAWRTSKVIADLINRKPRIRDINVELLAMVMSQVTIDQVMVSLYDNPTHYGCRVQDEQDLGISRQAVRIINNIILTAMKMMPNPRELYNILKSAPKFTVAGSIWNNIEKMDRSEEYDEFPSEDRKFWTNLYCTKSVSWLEERDCLLEELNDECMLDGYVSIGNTFSDLNERRFVSTGVLKIKFFKTTRVIKKA